MANTPKKKPIGARKSSFELIDSEKFFDELHLKGGDTVLDVAEDCMQSQHWKP